MQSPPPPGGLLKWWIDTFCDISLHVHITWENSDGSLGVSQVIGHVSRNHIVFAQHQLMIYCNAFNLLLSYHMILSFSLWYQNEMKWCCFMPLLCTLFGYTGPSRRRGQWGVINGETSPGWVRTSDPVIRSPEPCLWTTASYCDLLSVFFLIYIYV